MGEKPRNPEAVTGTLSDSTFTIKVTDGGKDMTFTVRINTPAGPGPFPAVIGYVRVKLGGSLAGLPVATIDYTTGDLFNKDAPNQMVRGCMRAWPRVTPIGHGPPGQRARWGTLRKRESVIPSAIMG